MGKELVIEVYPNHLVRKPDGTLVRTPRFIEVMLRMGYSTLTLKEVNGNKAE